MSGFGSLNAADWIKGFIVSVITASLTTLQQFISTSGTLQPINWKLVGGTALAAAIAYVLKNLLTDTSGKTLGIAATAPGPPSPPPKG